MIKDRNKNITEITYNHLNLPKKITFTGDISATIEYIYTANGDKLKKALTFNGSSGSRATDYLDGFQYYQGKLNFFPTTEGYVNATRISNDEYAYNYVYNYTDHLGNIRLRYTKDPEAETGLKILEEDHYYPFGLKHHGYNNEHNIFYPPIGTPNKVVIVPITPDSRDPYKYKYNGKEFQDELGLNWYDYGARNYDASLGRWMNVDPLGEKRESLTSYNFVSNNPITRIDPTGTLDGEFEEVVQEDGNTTTKKISKLGDKEGVDFTHIKGGKHDGQTRIESQTSGVEVYMKSSKNIEGFKQREGGINWEKVYDEFISGTGPENSLITTPAMLQNIMKSPNFGDAFNAYLEAGIPEKMQYSSSFGISGAREAGNNMTAQMIGKASYSFYNLGDKLVITIMDSKSVMSYSLNPIVKLLPKSWVNKDRSNSNVPVSQGTTRQTYLMMFDIRK